MNFILEKFYELVTSINNYIYKPKPSLIAPKQTQSTPGLQIKKVSTKITPRTRQPSARVINLKIESDSFAKTIKEKNKETYIQHINTNTDIHKYVFARCDTIHDFVLDTRGNSKIFDKVKTKVINQLNKTDQLNNDLISDYYSIKKNNDFGKKVKKILKGEIIPFQMSHVRITDITLTQAYVYIYVKGEPGDNYHSVQSGAYTIDYFKVTSTWRKYSIINTYGTFIDQTDFTKYVLIDIKHNGTIEANYKLELDKELISSIKTFTIKNLPVGGMWCKGDTNWTDIEQIEFKNYENDKNTFLSHALLINTEINNEEDDDEEDDGNNNTILDDSYICIYLYWSIAGKTSPYMIYVKISDISYDTLKNKYASITYYYFDNYTKYKPSTFPKILETKHIIENTQQKSFNFKSDINIIFKQEILGNCILFPPELLVKDLFNADYQGTWIANNKLQLNNSKPGKSYNDCVVELIENLTNIPKTINFHERNIFEYNGNSATLTMLNTNASSKFCSTYIVNNADIDSFVNTQVMQIFPPQHYNVAIDMDFSKISLKYIPILNTATLWDSSTASTVIISRQQKRKNPLLDTTGIETKNYPYIWFGEDAIITNNSSDAVFKLQQQTFETVKSRRHLKGLNTTSLPATPSYIYKTVGLLKDRIADATDIPKFVKPMSVAECINIKRSGDAFQIESIKTRNSPSSSVQKTFLLTGDQLFFCNCLISKVPVIHYYKTVDFQKTVFTIYNPFLLNSPLPIVGGTPSTEPEIILNCKTYCDLSGPDIILDANTFEECIKNIDNYFLSIIEKIKPEDINCKYLCDRLEEEIEFEIDQDEETNMDAMLIYHNAEILRDRIILWGFEGFEILKILGLHPVQIPTDNKDQLWVPYDTEMCILQVLHFFFDIQMLNECFQDIKPSQLRLQQKARRDVVLTWPPKPSVQPNLTSRGGFSKSKIRNLLFLRMLKKKKQIKIKLKQSISQTQQRP